MRYIAKVKDGGGVRTIEGEAGSRLEALNELHAGGYLLLSLEVERDEGKTPASHRHRILGVRPSSLDIEFGLQQLATMLRSGLSLLSALRTASEQARSRRGGRVWGYLADTIESGLSLHDAMVGSKSFNLYTLALIQVGEQTGELDSTLDRAAEHLSRQREVRSMLLNALIYPALVVLMTVGVVTLMVVKVIPQIEGFLAQANQSLPRITQWLLDFSLSVRLHGVDILIGLLALLLLLFLVRMTARGREETDRLALYLPITGPLLRLSRTAVVARGLSILLESGVSLLDALDTVTSLTRNRRLTHRLHDVHDSVMKGNTLAHALAAASEFMPMLSKMAAVGESTGTLASSLGEIAEFHEKMLHHAIRRLGTLIEPVLILIVGLVVGFVYTAFFMALFSIATTA